MAILRLENNLRYTQLNDIIPKLAPLNVHLKRLPLKQDPKLNALLIQENLDSAEKEQVLKIFNAHSKHIEKPNDYKSCDLIVLHPSFPNLDALLSKFDKSHIHADAEIRYIIAGEGVFGFVSSDGSQMELTVQPEDYINVPKGTEHWFYLTELRQIKAVRYFTTTEGWVPEYTGTEIRMSPSF